MNTQHRKVRQPVRTAKLAAILSGTVITAAPIVTPTLAPAAQAQFGPSQGNVIRVFLNGREINFQGVPPVQEAGRVLVPLRGVFEALGAFVDFNSATQTITATRGATRIQLTLGSTSAYVNGQLRVLDVPARTLTGRTLVPLRFVSEALGAQVDWNGNSRIINIASSVVTDPGTGNLPGTGTLPGTGFPGIGNDGYIGDEVNTVSGIVSRFDDIGTITIQPANSTQTRTYNLAPGARLYRRTTGRLVRTETPVYGSAVLVGSPTNRIAPGEDVRLRLNTVGEVTQITEMVSVVPTRIRDVQNDQITLDDAQGTLLTIGPSLRVYDSRGRVVNDASALTIGQRVALFIAPATRKIFAVSAAQNDLTLADSIASGLPYEGGDDTGTGDSAGMPQINSVTHTATRPLRAGQVLNVTVRGTAGMRGSFSVLPDVVEVPLREERAGVYTGSYTVQTGDNILNGRVSVTLRNASGRDTFQQSQTPVTIDTVAPRIISTSPANGANVNNEQPNIVINATDVGGSGLSSAAVTINGVAVLPEDITISTNSVTIISPERLNGQVTVNATISDRAGNQVRRNFSFFAADSGTGTGSSVIRSLTTNATRNTQSGDRITVDMRAPIGGTASFDVLGDNRAIVLRNVRMNEVADGRYRGTFTVPATDNALYVRARFVDANGLASTSEASAPIYVVDGRGVDGSGNDNIGNVTITSPRETDRVGTAVTVTGRADPYATVDVAVVAQGVRYYILEYSNDLGTRQVQADANGNWSTGSIELPRPNNVSNLRYVITAVQTDDANRRSDPATVTVTPR